MKRFNRTAISFTLAAGVALVGVGVTSAHSDSHEKMMAATDPIGARDVAMHAIADSMKALGAVAKGEAEPDAATVVHAERIYALSGTVKYLFPEGSTNAESRAKPEIWSDWAKFEAAADDFAMATPALVEAAKSGEAGQIGAALGEVGKTCGGCHKPFRAPKS